MKSPEENVIQKKSFSFAVNILKLCKKLHREKEFVLSRQLLRSGTSIGANIEEAIGGQSKKDFLAKITISYKEAREACYWLKFIREGYPQDRECITKLLNECNEICRILGKIQMTTKNNLQKPNS